MSVNPSIVTLAPEDDSGSLSLILVKQNREEPKFTKINDMKSLSCKKSNQSLVKHSSEDSSSIIKLSHQKKSLEESTRKIQVDYSPCLRNFIKIKTMISKEQTRFISKKISKNKEDCQNPSILKLRNDSDSEEDSSQSSFENNNYSQVQLCNNQSKGIIQQEMIKERVIVKYRASVYDSLSDDEENEDSNQSTRSKVFDPDSELIITVQTFMLCVSIYTCFISPYLTAFDINLKLSYLISAELLIDVVSIIDFMLNFSTGFHDDEENYVFERSKIAKHYLYRWFFMDIFTSVPANLIHYSLSSKFFFKTLPQNVSKNLKLLKFNKSFILFKYMSKSNLPWIVQMKLIIKKFCLMKDQAVVILNFIIKFFAVIHVSACLWIAMSVISQSNWITHSNINLATSIEIYISSAYFIMATIFTVGYGDIISTNFYERLFNCFLVLFGTFIYALAISSLSNYIYKVNENEKKHLDLCVITDELTENYKITPAFAIKVKAYLKSRLICPKDEIIALVHTLPLSIKRDLIFSIYSPEITNFKILSKIRNRDILLQLLVALRLSHCKQGDCLIEENESIDNMIFVRKGIISLRKRIDFIDRGLQQQFNSFNKLVTTTKKQPKPKSIKIIQLSSWDHFGDSLILSELKCPLSLIVKSENAELYLLSKADLTSLILTFKQSVNSILYSSVFNIEVLQSLIKRKLMANHILESISPIRDKIDSSLLENKPIKFQDYSSSIELKQHGINSETRLPQTLKKLGDSSSNQKSLTNCKSKAMDTIGKLKDFLLEKETKKKGVKKVIKLSKFSSSTIHKHTLKNLQITHEQSFEILKARKNWPARFKNKNDDVQSQYTSLPSNSFNRSSMFINSLSKGSSYSPTKSKATKTGRISRAKTIIRPQRSVKFQVNTKQSFNLKQERIKSAMTLSPEIINKCSAKFKDSTRSVFMRKRSEVNSRKSFINIKIQEREKKQDALGFINAFFNTKNKL